MVWANSFFLREPAKRLAGSGQKRSRPPGGRFSWSSGPNPQAGYASTYPETRGHRDELQRERRHGWAESRSRNFHQPRAELMITTHEGAPRVHGQKVNHLLRRRYLFLPPLPVFFRCSSVEDSNASAARADPSTLRMIDSTGLPARVRLNAQGASARPLYYHRRMPQRSTRRLRTIRAIRNWRAVIVERGPLGRTARERVGLPDPAVYTDRVNADAYCNTAPRARIVMGVARRR